MVTNHPRAGRTDGSAGRAVLLLLWWWWLWMPQPVTMSPPLCPRLSRVGEVQYHQGEWRDVQGEMDDPTPRRHLFRLPVQRMQWGHDGWFPCRAGGLGRRPARHGRGNGVCRSGRGVARETNLPPFQNSTRYRRGGVAHRPWRPLRRLFASPLPAPQRRHMQKCSFHLPRIQHMKARGGGEMQQQEGTKRNIQATFYRPFLLLFLLESGGGGGVAVFRHSYWTGHARFPRTRAMYHQDKKRIRRPFVFLSHRCE